MNRSAAIILVEIFVMEGQKKHLEEGYAGSNGIMFGDPAGYGKRSERLYVHWIFIMDMLEVESLYVPAFILCLWY